MYRILVIDDSEIILEVTRDALEGAGYEVLTASDPSEFHLAKEAAPDLILLDVNMPEVFGDDVATYFREAWGVTTPIYLFSDMPRNELAERAVKAGVNGFIPKTDGLDYLVTEVRSILTGE